MRALFNPKAYFHFLNVNVTLSALYELLKSTVTFSTLFILYDVRSAFWQCYPYNEAINTPITTEEITEAVMALQNNKSPGSDHILNEHIKSTLSSLLPIYLKLFNIIFDNGIFPESWVLGNIIPTYKNKGKAQNPENYRPIALISCVGKLFTRIISNRLTKYADKYNTERLSSRL